MNNFAKPLVLLKHECISILECLNWNMRHIHPPLTENKWKGASDKGLQHEHLVLSTAQKLQVEMRGGNIEMVNDSYGCGDNRGNHSK